MTDLYSGMLNRVKNWRENFRLSIYDNRHRILGFLRVTGMLVATCAVASMIYFYGFPRTPQSERITQSIIQGSLIFYLFKYFIKLLLSLDWRGFIRQNLFESFVMFILLLLVLFNLLYGSRVMYFFQHTLRIEYLQSYTIIFIQIYFFIIFALEIGKGSRFLANIHLGPAQMLTFSFIILICGGTFLLMLPEMTTGHAIRLVDALFTATSASCVTGLIVVDTATYFTLKGQIIIMLLIQLGGLNIISFATFFATFYRQSPGIKYQSLMKDFLSVDAFSDTKMLLRRIFSFSLIIEAIGCVFIYFLWGDQIVFKTDQQRWFFSLFHAISSFNNAGFSLFTNGLYEPVIRTSYFLHLTIAVLIFLGGIGFLALQDMLSIRSIRDRMRNPWRKFAVNTRVVLITSVFLICFGALVFYLLERNNTLKGLGVLGTIITCIFQAVTPRTAGFNTVDFTQLVNPTLIFLMFLMFVGASPGSTGGGIKTTTFAVLIKSVITTITGRKSLEFFRQSIKEEAVSKAYAIVLFSLLLTLVSSFFLTITEKNISFIRLLFEEISAFGTVGLTTGVTPLLTEAGKAIIIASMFIGRIGTLTLALTLSKRAPYTKYKYSTANLQIG